MAKDSLNDSINSINPTDKKVLQIYIACLAAYNSSIAYGKWIDATQEIEAIHVEIQEMLFNSPIAGAKEFAVHAFDGFGPLRLDEYESVESIHEKARFILKHGELGAELLVYYGNVESAQDAIENRYHGEYKSQIDFAIQLFEDCHMESIPEMVQCYIDYASFKRDIFLKDFFSLEVRDKTHVFAHG